MKSGVDRSNPNLKSENASSATEESEYAKSRFGFINKDDQFGGDNSCLCWTAFISA
jgi:hypothetical protein